MNWLGRKEDLLSIFQLLRLILNLPVLFIIEVNIMPNYNKRKISRVFKIDFNNAYKIIINMPARANNNPLKDIIFNNINMSLVNWLLNLNS